MKSFFIFFVGVVFVANTYAISLESDDEGMSAMELEQMLSDAEEKDKGLDSTKRIETIKKVGARKDVKKKAQETSKPQEEPFMFISAGYIRSKITSVLENANGTKERDYASNALELKVGFMDDGSDIFYAFMSRKLGNGLAIIAHDFGWRLRFTMGMMTPFVTLSGGYANAKTKPDSTKGLNLSAHAGFLININYYSSIELGYSINRTYWDYPVEGVVNYYKNQAYRVAYEFRF